MKYLDRISLKTLSGLAGKVFRRAEDFLHRAFRQRVLLPTGELELPGWRQPVLFAAPVISLLIGLGWCACKGVGRRTGWVLLVTAGLYTAYLIAEWVTLLAQYTTSTAASPVELLVTHNKPLCQHLGNVLESANGCQPPWGNKAIASEVESILKTLKAVPPWTKVALFLFRRIGLNFVFTVFAFSSVQIAALSLESPEVLLRYSATAGGYRAVMADYVLSESVVMLGSQSNSPPSPQSIPGKLFMAVQNFYLTWFLTLVVGAALVTVAVVESSLRDTDALSKHFTRFISQRVPMSSDPEDLNPETKPGVGQL